MLKVNKELSRASGGIIPAGAILDFQITQLPPVNVAREKEKTLVLIKEKLKERQKVQIVFTLFHSMDAFITGKPPVPIQDVLEFRTKEGQPVQGGFYIPLDKSIEGQKTFSAYMDTIAKAYVEEEFLGVGSTEAIGLEIIE